MTHNEKRASPLREFQIAVLTGAIYGASHTISGHPLDNLKTQLQLNPAYRGLSTPAAASKLWTELGLRGYFRGLFPPLIGSACYRSVMLSSYEFSYTYFKQLPKDSFWQTEIAGGYFPRPMVWVSSVFCSLTRSLAEAPFEQAKVMRQTGRSWTFTDVYRGVGLQTARTTALLVCIFGPYDVIREKTTWMNSFVGSWMVVSAVCGGAYAAMWPLETLKNAAQAAVPRAGASVQERIAHLGGVRGLYRGALPGIVGGGMRNGCAFVAMVYATGLATRLGLRDE